MVVKSLGYQSDDSGNESDDAMTIFDNPYDALEDSEEKLDATTKEKHLSSKPLEMVKARESMSPQKNKEREFFVSDRYENEKGN